MGLVPVLGAVVLLLHSKEGHQPSLIKPTLTVLYSTNVRVEVKKLSQKEEHGSAVTQCQVQ